MHRQVVVKSRAGQPHDSADCAACNTGGQHISVFADPQKDDEH